MNAVVLAGGYATRLRPLTDTIAKPLLPVGGRPMLDWILARIQEVDELETVHVVTNAVYVQDFERWAAGQAGIVVHDDGTTTNEDRLGAIGDIRFAVEHGGLEGDDLLVIAGDNLFEFGLPDLVAFWRAKGVASALAVHDCGSLELARQYGIVELDADGRIVSLVEKPDDPPSTLAATATYLFHREHVPLVGRYLDEGNPPDPPGNLLVWLQEREPVYGFRFEGAWLDIGTPEQLLDADNRMRAIQGLPSVDEYTLSAQS